MAPGLTWHGTYTYHRTGTRGLAGRGGVIASAGSSSLNARGVLTEGPTSSDGLGNARSSLLRVCILSRNFQQSPRHACRLLMTGPKSCCRSVGSPGRLSVNVSRALHTYVHLSNGTQVERSRLVLQRDLHMHFLFLGRILIASSIPDCSNCLRGVLWYDRSCPGVRCPAQECTRSPLCASACARGRHNVAKESMKAQGQY